MFASVCVCVRESGASVHAGVHTCLATFLCTSRGCTQTHDSPTAQTDLRTCVCVCVYVCMCVRALAAEKVAREATRSASKELYLVQAQASHLRQQVDVITKEKETALREKVERLLCFVLCEMSPHHSLSRHSLSALPDCSFVIYSAVKACVLQPWSVLLCSIVECFAVQHHGVFCCACCACCSNPLT